MKVILLMIAQILCISCYEYIKNKEKEDFIKLIENNKNNIPINDTKFKHTSNLRYINDEDKFFNCIIKYYKAIEKTQRTIKNDFVSFEDYYDYWYPNTMSWICNRINEKYNLSNSDI